MSMWVIIVLGGLFCIIGALFNWDLLMENKSSRWSRYGIRLLSRNASRILYFLIGLALVIIGAIGVLGVI